MGLLWVLSIVHVDVKCLCMGSINKDPQLERSKVLPPSWKVQSIVSDVLHIFGRLEQNVSTDPTRKWTLLFGETELVQNKINKRLRAV